MRQLFYAAVMALLLAPGATGAAAQTAGETKLGVTTIELNDIVKGWSVRHKLLGQEVYNDKDERVGKIEDIIITPERIGEWQDKAKRMGVVEHEVLTREPDGTISGMTDVEWTPYGRTVIQQQFTGVLPSARGRGIGKWIKAAMLLHIRELHPDARWVSTENAESNGPMLSINRAMGFKPYRKSTEYQMSREKLAEKIRSL